MIDLHSHFLPSMDDGSKSVDESIAMLKESINQGVEIMVATPHFYADHEDPESFLKRRIESFDRLDLNDELPQVVLGAEVAYFRGISHCEELDGLRIGKSKLILLEMPFSAWTNTVIDDVCSINVRTGLIPVIAHYERYRKLEGYNEGLKIMKNCGIMIQSNAENFSGMIHGRKALKDIENGTIDFIGSDCHNMSSRAPNMVIAKEKIGKNCGEKMLEVLDKNIHKWLNM